jgi:hypothetical protein
MSMDLKASTVGRLFHMEPAARPRQHHGVDPG